MAHMASSKWKTISSPIYSTLFISYFEYGRRILLFLTVTPPSSHDRLPLYIKWHPSNSTPFKLNADGSAQLPSRQGGIDGVIRDSSGTWLMCFAGYHFSHGSMDSELSALYHGLKLHGYKPLEVNASTHTIG